MHLTHYTDYALRVLIYLNLHRQRRCTAVEIAGHFRVSHHHLRKVIQDLHQRGYVTTIRGKGGGLYLLRSPEQIVIGTLVRELEPDMKLTDCFESRHHCVIAPACRGRQIFGLALKQFLAVLDQHTLADLMPPRARGQCIELLYQGPS
ncbi:Rrf2 family transcriptional regulator [Zobellella endophytica]|uniref:Rrf2 family transcriptional regulator n=1 Tax=Zobellella endophytica TaxID=2116700 RepID=A0A2P7R7X6_9GAMM|nr:Rrf2 family transcriptional regulator [Zobellella endophytica]PSJ46325.1 Rrf2 family transcriptional regulator [Zobellella endophytica]